MNKAQKLKAKLLAGQGLHNFAFSDALFLMESLGFILRIEGSHHFFTHPKFPEVANFQNRNGKCKAYQLRQARTIIKNHNL